MKVKNRSKKNTNPRHDTITVVYSTPSTRLRDLAYMAELKAFKMGTEVPIGGELLCERIKWINFHAALLGAAKQLKFCVDLLGRVDDTPNSHWHLAG